MSATSSPGPINTAGAVVDNRFDVIVIGAGPGGYVAAIRAAQLGRSVAVVEDRYWGGICLNVGCIPSKSLLRNAELALTVTREAEKFGLVGEITADYRVAYSRSREVAEGRVKGVHFLMRKNGITEIDGRAAFTGPNTVVVRTVDGSRTLTFTDAIIATGARPRTLPGVALSERVVTYESIVLGEQVPESVVVVGAGAVGVELSYVMNAYGTSVTILESADRVLPAEDLDVSKEALKAFKQSGIDVQVSAAVISTEESDDAVTVHWTDAKGERQESRAAKVLLATGFEPNTDDLGLFEAGVETDARGAVVINERMRTSAPGVYAIGDVTMKMALAHVAEAQGVVAAETIADATTMELGDYRMMPRATFCHPQVASFGLTEEQAHDEHGPGIRVAKFPLSANGKAHGLGDATGLVKIIATATGELLGGHLVGSEVAELLPELTLAQKWDLGSFELARNVHVHPTIGEALQETFHGLEGHMINL